MFDNTLTLTGIRGDDRALVRVNQDKFSSTYRLRLADLTIDMVIRHTDRATPGKPGSRTERHNVEVTATDFVTVGDAKVLKNAKFYFVFEKENGDNYDLAWQLAKAVCAIFVTNESKFSGLNNWES